MEPRVTVRDLAKETKFHFTTVAMALRGDPRISQETIAIINAAAVRRGYRPDPMLSALSSYRHRRGAGFRGVVGLLAPVPKPDRPATAGPFKIYQDLQVCADNLGLKIECHDISQPGLTGKRLSEILIARGIQGLLLAPIPRPGPYLDLAWEHFYSVAIGYSVQQPAVHRACFHQARSIRLHLTKLRSLGYRRIGLMLTWNGDLRTDHNYLGAYLAEQQEQSEAMRLKPFLCGDEIEKDKVAAWLETEKPDCVMTVGPSHLELITELGYSVPGDIGVSTYGWTKENPHIAGVDERWEALAATALNLLMQLMTQCEFGIPAYPRYALIEGVWKDGTTVRAKAPAKPAS